MNKYLFTALLLGLSGANAQAQGVATPFKANAQPAQTFEKCQNVTPQAISGLFDRWNQALKTGNPDTVAAEYADNAVLLPTLSNRVRTSPTEIRDYFVGFLKKSPVGSIDSQSIRIGCNNAISSGIYTFKFSNGEKAQARYSYVYEYQQGQWKIVSHHSSLMPEKAGSSSEH